MKRRPLGRTGFTVSEIGFGGWAIGGGWGDQDDAVSLAALHRALDLGVDFIDTAPVYGKGRSERLIGRVLRERGEKITVATKTPPTKGPWPPSPYCRWQDRYPEKYLRQNVEQRLRNLGRDCIDLLQLHSWTRNWNRDPRPLEVLQKMKTEGKISAVGVSAPEHDQNCVIDLMRVGLVDTVQVIYNLFEQEPVSELLPVAEQHAVGIIVRQPFDEGALTGKFTFETRFPSNDFRAKYFARDRIQRTVSRVARIIEECTGSGFTMPQLALKFILMHPAVSSVIPGIRSVAQAEENASVSELPEVLDDLMLVLRQHAWRRAYWYSG